MCYCPTLRCYFVSTDVAFFETTPFSLSSIVTSPGEDSDLLVYHVSLSIPTLAPIPVVRNYVNNIFEERIKVNNLILELAMGSE